MVGMLLIGYEGKGMLGLLMKPYVKLGSKASLMSLTTDFLRGIISKKFRGVFL